VGVDFSFVHFTFAHRDDQARCLQMKVNPYVSR
jgi:hypothetical protein